MSRLTAVLKSPERLFDALSYRGFLNFLPDKLYLKIKFYFKQGKKLNLKNPKTFNEKLQWLKLYDRKPVYIDMVDKYDAKKYVADIIGEEYIIPTLGVWDKFDDIDFDKLPDQFVLKCTHDSGGLVVCKDKSKLDIDKAREKINRSLKRSFFHNTREWPYKGVKRRIIAEQFMEEEGSTLGLTDYKFYCFNGEPKLLYVSKGLDDHDNGQISFLTMDWEFAPFRRMDFAPLTELPKKPENYDKMIEMARELSKGLAFLRVDLYEINHKIYFSELTFFPNSGFMPYSDEKWNLKMGEWIDLDITK